MVLAISNLNFSVSKLSKPWCLRASIFSSLTILSACATPPQSTYPAISTAEVESARFKLQRSVIESNKRLDKRLQTIALTVWQQNQDFCGLDDSKLSLGWRIDDALTIHQLAFQLKREHIDALGYDNTPRIGMVVEKGPAAMAGIRPGDIILSVSDSLIDIDQGQSVHSSIREALLRLNKKPEPIDVAVDRNGEHLTFQVLPILTCRFPVRLIPVAQATGRPTLVQVGAPFLEDLDDNVIAFILGHELAHATLRHHKARDASRYTNGSYFYGWLLRGLADVGDYFTSIVGLGRRSPSYETRVEQLLGDSVYNIEYETEADYVGLYLSARAGFEIKNVEKFFEYLSLNGPRSTWLEITHPANAERQVLVERTREEIKEKRTRGDSLWPNGISEDR